jgi:hypothetical protein
LSLDVTLVHASAEPRNGSGIYVRRDGQTVEVTRDEWDAMYPGREPVVAVVDDWNEGWVYDANITHNLGKMAGEVGLYEPLWRPEEIGASRAGELVAPLRDGLARLVDERDRLQEFNPSNGWGDYDGLVRFTADYLAACERWPEAEVRVSR